MLFRSVLVCLSDAAVYAGASASVCEMLHKKYVTSVAFTGAAAAADVAQSRPAKEQDMNLLAKLAASQGVGYGEAIARWGFPADARAEKSVIHAAYSAAVPATIHAEVGEMPEHLYAAARGAELGAAVGAASYVDLLIFTEQIRRAIEDGGVVIVIGAAHRFARLLEQAARAAETTVSKTGRFCVCVVDRFLPEDDLPTVKQYGAVGFLFRGSLNSYALNLLQACDAVYSGSVPNEFKK